MCERKGRRWADEGWGVAAGGRAAVFVIFGGCHLKVGAILEPVYVACNSSVSLYHGAQIKPNKRKLIVFAQLRLATCFVLFSSCPVRSRTTGLK